MATHYILYHPLAGTDTAQEDIKLLAELCPVSTKLVDIRTIKHYDVFLHSLSGDDVLILAGGDGSLNRFANKITGLQIRQKILYYPIGTGNDFARDLGYAYGAAPFPINQYLQKLPMVTVNGQTHRFLNAVGFGIDGYCCEKGDRLRAEGKKINYTSIAIHGLLFYCKPVKAVITVDGVRHAYSNVWLAPTMFGRYYGGGMIPAPAQNRTCQKLSVMVFHCDNRLQALLAFPSIFKGTHIKYKNMTEVLEGNHITVEFDRPACLQIDGETITDVVSYSAVYNI